MGQRQAKKRIVEPSIQVLLCCCLQQNWDSSEYQNESNEYTACRRDFFRFVSKNRKLVIEIDGDNTKDELCEAFTAFLNASGILY